MTALSKRKSKLSFQTSDTVRERGRTREVVIECNDTFAVVRLKGTRSRFSIEWSAIYTAAAKLAAASERREKLAAKKARRA
ncbi:MAG: hypothetical protein ACLQLH_03610 [Terracidiphilus sp.]